MSRRLEEGGVVMDWKRTGVGIATIVAAFALAFAGGASGSTRSGDHHVLVTFSGSGKGAFKWSEPQQNNPGGATCVEPANSYSVKDNYTFKWSEKLTFPEGVGSYVLPKNYKVGGTDVTTQVQSACMNDFGNTLGGDSYSCTQKWNPLPASDTNYPSVSMGGRSSHLFVKVAGGIQQSGRLTGSNCVGASVGGALNSYSFEGLKGSLTFSTAKLEHGGSLSKHVGASLSANCSGTSCDHLFCKNDNTSDPVPVTCNNSESFTAELKVELVK
jgi:hypothetical protein